MASDVQQIKERIWDILSAEASIARVRGMSVQNVIELPAAIINAEGATYERDASDLLRVRRDYRIIILAQAARQGLELDAEAATEAHYQTMRELFWNRPGLTLYGDDPLPGVRDAHLTQDSGFTILNVANVSYAACSFILHVESVYDLEQGV